MRVNPIPRRLTKRDEWNYGNGIGCMERLIATNYAYHYDG
jgi:hypothetical protein